MAQFLDFPLEIPALTVPLVTERGALENKGLAVESCWYGEGKLLSPLRAEPDVQNQKDALISQCSMRKGFIRGGWRVGGIKYVNISLDESGG